jgi:hypothetical protein
MATAKCFLPQIKFHSQAFINALYKPCICAVTNILAKSQSTSCTTAHRCSTWAAVLHTRLPHGQVCPAGHCRAGFHDVILRPLRRPDQSGFGSLQANPSESPMIDSLDLHRGQSQPGMIIPDKIARKYH